MAWKLSRCLVRSRCMAMKGLIFDLSKSPEPQLDPNPEVYMANNNGCKCWSDPAYNHPCSLFFFQAIEVILVMLIVVFLQTMAVW